MLAAVAGCGRGAQPPPPASALVGDSTCVGCHREQASFASTAHARTSAPAGRATVSGSFHPDSGVLRTSSPYLHYRMEARDSGLFQVAVTGAAPDTTQRAERLDLVVGSGRRGQTFAYWTPDGRLFQLPVSHWTSAQGWRLSPGYSEGHANFERPVTPRCLECHATRVDPAPAPAAVNHYDREGARLGISCETCHGAGRTHVERQRSPVARLLGRAVTQPARMSRVRQVEACALCHAGAGELVGEAFAYRPGQPLETHLRLPPPQPGDEADVHGNQVALLARSACFERSEMTCTTCHDVHREQRDAAAFIPTCLSCHEPSAADFPHRGEPDRTDCVGCHMPLRVSRTIAEGTGALGRERLSVRSHWIRVYR